MYIRLLIIDEYTGINNATILNVLETQGLVERVADGYSSRTGEKRKMIK